MSSSVAQDLSSRVVTRARVGYPDRVTYFELGCPETNIDPNFFLGIPRNKGVNFRGKFRQGIPRKS